MSTNEDLASRIRSIPLFSSLNVTELMRLVERLREREIPAGGLVLKQGDQGDCMFLIHTGAVQVFATGFDGADVVLARLERGQWFGEQSLLPGASARRSASVRALESSRLLELRRDALLEALDQQLTEVALALGWTSPATPTPFDLLPVIVQVPGSRPAYREIPGKLVMEIPIVHPELGWFAELGLKWYALPAVSGMLFDTGVVQYAAAPFNGWYMGTEIGARNFGDTARYDLLPAVARRMGLDTSRDRTLWRDRALIELNVAVLYSYEIAGVTMMDHHAAAHSFNKFESIEARAGRPVHARWAWIVPPISGSATTVFHQDWPDVEIKPNYYYQPDPWKEDRSWSTEREPPALPGTLRGDRTGGTT